MSLFQCENCGCCENTALTPFGGIGKVWQDIMDWAGIEERQGKKLCSACSPSKFKNGEICDRGGKWHGEFKRKYLPMGMFRTAKNGNLEHIKTGSQDYNKYVLEQEHNDD